MNLLGGRDEFLLLHFFVWASVVEQKLFPVVNIRVLTIILVHFNNYSQVLESWAVIRVSRQ